MNHFTKDRFCLYVEQSPSTVSDVCQAFDVTEKQLMNAFEEGRIKQVFNFWRFLEGFPLSQMQVDLIHYEIAVD